MKHPNTIGVDIAKNVIQISIVSPSNKQHLRFALKVKLHSNLTQYLHLTLTLFEGTLMNVIK